MEEITIPTIKQVENLKVLRKYGTEAEPTGLYLIQKGWSISNKGEYFTKTQVPNTTPYVFRITTGGYKGDWDTSERNGIRPILSLSKISNQFLKKKVINNIEEIEYGEYPQSIVDETLKKELENLYQQNKLNKTNKKYTFLEEENNVYEEYLYKKDKYIRVKEKKKQKIYWVKVKPIKWLIDERENIAISKYILANMPFSQYGDNRYEKSDIKYFLENYFIKEIISKNKQRKKSSKNDIDINKIDDLIDIMNRLSKEEKPKQKVR